MIIFTVLSYAVIGLSLASPNGVYHQEYNYKTSSQSYKNNELQHKNDDSGYFSKDGDLEGRTKPKINAHSEHSEYLNPKLKANGGYGAGQSEDAYGRTSSFGQLNAQNQYGQTHGQEGYGLSGSSGSSLSGSAYGSSSQLSGAHYGVNSNLQQLTRQLQSELSRQLQDAIYEQRRQNAAYSSSDYNSAQAQNLVRELEDNLKRNLTMKLEEALRSQYGVQGIQGAYSYTLANGRLQPTANYEQQELTDLTRQVEDNLLDQLQEGVKTQFHSSSSSSSSRYSTNADSGIKTGSYRPQYSQYPSGTTTLHSGSQIQGSSQHYPINQQYTPSRPYPSTQVYPNNQVRYPSHTSSGTNSNQHSTSSSVSITSIATSVQDRLDDKLNELLSDTRRRYFSEDSYGDLTNYDALLSRLQDELRSNISVQLDDEIRRNYGYGHNSYGGYSTTTQYNQADLEALKRQMEQNLITKLNRDFNNQKNHYLQTHSSSSSSSRYYQSNNPTHYPSTQIISGSRGYVAGTKNGGHSASQIDLSQIQRQLQDSLSRQLQTAISQSNAYSSSSSNSQYTQHYQDLVADLNRNLTDQLDRILAQHGYSSSGSAYGYSGNSQLANLKSQLQQDLQRQLQQGLQQSWSSHSSWSASSASSYRPTRTFGSTVDSHQGYNCYDCMMGDDPSANNDEQMQADGYHHLSYGPAPKQNYDHFERDQQIQMTYGHHHGPYHHRHFGNVQEEEDDSDLTQQTEDFGSDLTQQPEDFGLGRVEQGHSFSSSQRYNAQFQQSSNSRYRSHHRVQSNGGSSYGPTGINEQSLDRNSQRKPTFSSDDTQETELTQQTEDIGLGRLELNNQQKPVKPYDQTQETDLTQQTEDIGFGKLELNNQQKPVKPFDQTQEESDLTQQTEDIGFGNLEINSQQTNRKPTLTVGIVDTQREIRKPVRESTSDLTQQTEDIGFGKLEINNQQPSFKPFDSKQQESDLTQQTEDIGIGKLEKNIQQIPVDLDQQVTDLTQQTEDIGFGKLETNNHQNPIKPFNQTQEESDLTQQTEDIGFGKLEISSQQATRKPNIPVVPINVQHETRKPITQSSSHLTQQTENIGFGKVELSHQQESIKPFDSTQQESDLTQQTEDIGFGNLQSESQQKPRRIFAQTQNQQGLTQQTEDVGFGKLGIVTEQSQAPIDSQREEEIQRQLDEIVDAIMQDAKRNQKSPDNQDLTQQTEDVLFGNNQKPQPSNIQSSPNRADSEVDTSSGYHSRHHTRDHVGYGTLHIGNLHNSRPIPTYTMVESQQKPVSFSSDRAVDSDLTQQTMDQTLSYNSQVTQQEETIGHDNVMSLTPPKKPNQWNSYDHTHRTNTYSTPNTVQKTFEDDLIDQEPGLRDRLESSTNKININDQLNSQWREKQTTPKQNTDELLVKPLEESGENHQRHYHHESRQESTGRVRITYNPRIVHYPASNSHGSSNQESTIQQSYSSRVESHSTPRKPVHYGTQSEVEDKFETASDIERIEPQRANVGFHAPPSGIKTRRISRPVPPSAVAQETSTESEVEIFELTTTPAPGFWKRLGNKVTSFKEKIIG